MEKHILSKSTYIKGEQCLKQLYLAKKRPFLRDRMPAERLAIFSRGTKVGVYAQQLFPGGIDAGPKHPSQYRKAVETTTKLIAAGQEIIYEAAVQSNKTLILLDILVKNGEEWDAYEVKSSKKLSETYYKDAALQYHVLVDSGLPIRTFSLIHINEEYLREDEIDISKLFITVDVTEEVRNRQSDVILKIEEEIEVLNDAHSPKINIGTHCHSPYDCDFIGHCWKKVPRPSIIDIPSISFEQQFHLFDEKKNLEEYLQNKTLSEINKMQIITQINDSEYSNLDMIKKRLGKSLDAYLLKVLYFTPALPLYPKTKAYEAIPFAYAFKRLNNTDAGIVFIAKGDKNPKYQIINRLTEELVSEIPVFIYSDKNDTIENTNTSNLGKLLIDGHYYHPSFKKDYSSKSLAKALKIKPSFKSIEMNIVAAQYYDEIIRGHKDSVEKRVKIISYLEKELVVLEKFIHKLKALS